MTLKIIRVLNAREPYQPNGKPYTIYAWTVTGIIDNDGNENVIELKAFKSVDVKEGSVFEVEKQNYMGKISFKILKEIKESSPVKPNHNTKKATYSKGNYTLEEYNNLFNYAWDMFEPRLSSIQNPSQKYECLQKLISTFIISAVQNGIKAPKIPNEMNPYDNYNAMYGGAAS